MNSKHFYKVTLNIKFYSQVAHVVSEVEFFLYIKQP